MTQTFDFENDSLYIFDFLNKAYQKLKGFKNWVSKFFGLVGVGVIFAVSWLFIVALLWFIYQIYRYSRDNSKTIEINSDNYQHWKKMQDIWNEKIQNSIGLDIKGISKLPFWERIPLYYIILIERLTLEDKRELDRQLQKLDNTCQHNSYFTQITEDQLWEQRNKAYNYLM